MISLRKIKQITGANKKLKAEGYTNILELIYKDLRSGCFYPSLTFMNVELSSTQVTQYLSQRLFNNNLNQSFILSKTLASFNFSHSLKLRVILIV